MPEEIRPTFVSMVRTPTGLLPTLVVLKGDVILLLRPELEYCVAPGKLYAVSQHGIIEVPSIG